jgi:hypothetical protein
VITASTGAVSGSLSITVGAAPVVSAVDVAPAALTLEIDQSAALTTTATWSDSETSNVTSAMSALIRFKRGSLTR